jgi:hypothetical protein
MGRAVNTGRREEDEAILAASTEEVIFEEA